MAVTLVTVKAKLPVGWNAEKNQVISEKDQPVQVTQIATLQDALSHYKGEEKLVEAINGFLRENGIRSEYSARVAKVKPSDMSETERIERAVNALVKTGHFTIETARNVVKAQMDAAKEAGGEQTEG